VESRPRVARIADIPGIRECYLRSWRAAYDGDLSPDVLNAEAEKRLAFDWSRGISADTSAVFVATDEDVVVGVVQADESLPSPRDRPEITMLYVDPVAGGRARRPSCFALVCGGSASAGTTRHDCASSRPTIGLAAFTNARAGSWTLILSLLGTTSSSSSTTDGRLATEDHHLSPGGGAS
jgi:hypothetical protein